MSDLRTATDIQAELERYAREAVTRACQPLVVDGRAITVFEEKFAFHARERFSQISGSLAIGRDLATDVALERGVRAGIEAVLRRLRALESENVEVWRAAIRYAANEVEKMGEAPSVKTIAGQVVR